MTYRTLFGFLFVALMALADFGLAAPGFAPPVSGPAWSDASNWNAPEYYSTIRALDLNDDGLDDLCARSADGVVCAFSNGNGFDAVLPRFSFSDTCCAAPEYYRTIRVMETTNADYYCLRISSGFFCSIARKFAFGSFGLFTDDDGWNEPDHYDTMVMVNLNNDEYADICARSTEGIVCHRTTGTGANPFEPSPIVGPAWSDAAAWNAPQYYQTIRALDFNGDGNGDLCARGAGGVVCYPSTGDGFGDLVAGPGWADAGSWDQPQYYETITALDFNGDGLDDLCARSPTGVLCHASTGTGFGVQLDGPPWSDITSWLLPQFYRTIRALDFNGDGLDDLCARSLEGWGCYPSVGTGFGALIAGPAWRDADGWDQPEYYETILALDYNGDGFDDVCARAASGMLCYQSNELLFRDGHE